MSTVRPPAAAPAPVTTPAEALRLVAALTDLRPNGPPGTEEIVCLFLDEHGVGGVGFVVPDAPAPDTVVLVADCAIAVARAGTAVTQLVLASVRAPDRPRTRDDDAQLWLQLDRRCAAAGLELLDWLVISPGRADLPREAVGVPSRWPHDAAPG